MPEEQGGLQAPRWEHLGGLTQVGISVFNQVSDLVCLARPVPRGAVGESECSTCRLVIDRNSRVRLQHDCSEQCFLMWRLPGLLRFLA